MSEVSCDELLSFVVHELHQRCLGACVVESGLRRKLSTSCSSLGE